jgi:hypothetical protein
MLDNVLIVSPKKEVRDAWYEQFYDKCRLSSAILKVKPLDKADDPPEPLTPEFKKLLDQQALMTMRRGQCSEQHEFEFMGIQWGHDYHYLAVSEEELQQRLPPGTRSDLSWHGTHRDLASILGKVNWHRRIYSLKSYDDTLPARHLREAYQILTPKDNRWSGKLPDAIAPENFKGIIEAWQHRNRQERLQAKVQSRQFNSPLFIATDASSSNQLAAAVYLRPDARHANITQTWKHDFADHRKIASAELLAIRNAVLSDHALDHDLIVLATDSMTCKSWIERGCAPTSLANAMLKEIFLTLEQRAQRLFVIYVPTDDNVADEPSRDKQIIAAKERKTRARLELAFRECLGTWSVAGGSTGASSASPMANVAQDAARYDLI